MSDEGEYFLESFKKSSVNVNDISELQSAITDGKALYHKKDYGIAIKKIENILGSSTNKRLLSEVQCQKCVKYSSH